MEMTYMQLLMQLEKDVESDTIPDAEKGTILNLIYRLELLLWKYSA